MANADTPLGFRPLRHRSGGEVRTTQYTVTTGDTIYQGDLVTAEAAGTVTAAAVDDGIAVVGVAAHYVDDSASAGGKTILIYDDPNIVFRVQMDDAGTASTAADIFSAADHLAGSGDSTTKQSGHELDMSKIGSTEQLKIIGLVREDGNAWGANADVEVVINEHKYHAAVAGL